MAKAPRGAGPAAKRPACRSCPGAISQSLQADRGADAPSSSSAIHDTSMRILETHGLEFLNDGALDLLASAGADVDRGTASRALRPPAWSPSTSPRRRRSFTLHARNPAHSLTIGGNHITFCAVSSAPNCSDLDRGRRPGNYAGLLRPAAAHPEPQRHPARRRLSGRADRPAAADPPSRRLLRRHHARPTASGRPRRSAAAHRATAIEMNCIARGITREQLAREPGLLHGRQHQLAAAASTGRCWTG